MNNSCHHRQYQKCVFNHRKLRQQKKEHRHCIIQEIKKGLTHFITHKKLDGGEESYEFLNKRRGKSKATSTPCYLYGFGLTLSLIVFPLLPHQLLNDLQL